ncbi:unnamed protein product [Auanema sp. JU1783]|nr:unnamed protein product [Auanema sp. JU1783]
MQTIEKALHQPMPFTTGGQTISDRLTAAKHSLAGSQLGKTICKATTEELMAPKKKHLDYLLHCTNEPNVSIPSMANLLIERTQHPSWTVVYKALITIHNIMCYGNERFSQYLASCNTTFNLGNFLDKNSTAGYDMSQHVRRYGKYIGEKIATYRVCAFDFCKVKRGREDGLLRTMHTDKLLKTLPILQNQIDALLEFQVSSSELNNGVINCSFILLFRDLIRLFACYNDGIINLLEKYFDMNKKQCREALDTYKGFLTRLDKVSDFLRVAESVGIDKGEIPDLTRAPASLLEALEAHLIHLEGGRAPAVPQQNIQYQNQVNSFSIAGGFQPQAPVNENERQRYIELEKERLRQFEEQKRQQGSASQFNPFAADAAAVNGAGALPEKNNDLLDFFNTPVQPATVSAADSTNPFAQFTSVPSVAPAYAPLGMNSTVSLPYGQSMMPAVAPTPIVSHNGFNADFNRAFSAQAPSKPVNGTVIQQQGDTNPFLAEGGVPSGEAPPEQWQPNFDQVQQQQQQQQQQQHVPAANPFTGGYTQSPPEYGAPPSQEYAPSVPIGIPGQAQHLGIYEQTPFSHLDHSYTAQPNVPSHVMHENSSSNEQSPAHQGQGIPQHPQQQGSFDVFNTNQAKMGGDIDLALSSLADNLSISSNKAQPNQPVQWSATSAPPARPPPPATSQPTLPAYTSAPPNGPYVQQTYGNPYGPPQPYGMPNQMHWGMQQQGAPMYAAPAQQAYGMPTQMSYGGVQPQMNYGMAAQPAPQAAQAPMAQPKDPFGGF